MSVMRIKKASMRMPTANGEPIDLMIGSSGMVALFDVVERLAAEQSGNAVPALERGFEILQAMLDALSER
jgi:hypothetical protein